MVSPLFVVFVVGRRVVVFTPRRLANQIVPIVAYKGKGPSGQQVRDILGSTVGLRLRVQNDLTFVRVEFGFANGGIQVIVPTFLTLFVAPTRQTGRHGGPLFGAVRGDGLDEGFVFGGLPVIVLFAALLVGLVATAATLLLGGGSNNGVFLVVIIDE